MPKITRNIGLRISEDPNPHRSVPDVCCPEEIPTFTIPSSKTRRITRTRGRGCNSPTPSDGGKECEGEDTDTAPCSLEECSLPVEIPPECGRSRVTQIRITNGQPARKNAWPWQVAIGQDCIWFVELSKHIPLFSGYKDERKDGQIDYLCGGSLVTKRLEIFIKEWNIFIFCIKDFHLGNVINHILYYRILSYTTKDFFY